jgi:hypothetical protein
VAEIRDCGTAFILANYILNVEKIPPKQIIEDRHGIESAAAIIRQQYGDGSKKSI